MEHEISIVEVSLQKPIEKFGPWLVQQMNHSGLPLYLILHPEEIEILSGARPIGLEVNLPTGLDVYTGRDYLNRGRSKKKVDLVFEKDHDYYLVEIMDKKKTITSKDKEKIKEYVRRFKENLGTAENIRVIPIIARPKDSVSRAFILTKQAHE